MLFRRTSYLPSDLAELTSARAFAAFTVVMFHMYFSAQNPPGVMNNIIRDGHLGVDFFFLLSGLILTHVYVTGWRAGTFDYRDFMVKRFARLYPLHLCMIALYLAAYQGVAMLGTASSLDGQDWHHLPFHVLLLHAWGTTDGHSWNFPSWSISAEFFAYLIFPVILLACTKLRVWGALCGAVLVFLADERLIVVTMIVVLAALVEYATLPHARVLRSRVLVYLGEISYATYMAHMLVLTVFDTLARRMDMDARGWTASIICFVLIYAGSAILHAIVERPGNRFCRRALREASA